MILNQGWGFSLLLLLGCNRHTTSRSFKVTIGSRRVGKRVVMVPVGLLWGLAGR